MTGTAGDTGEVESHRLAPVRPGDVVANKYVVEHVIGVGGMGIVLAARDRGLDRRVAIKFLLPKLACSETAVQRFIREARSATRITSEHVVKLFEIDKLPSGVPFFVMEYLEGHDLRAVLRDRGPLPIDLSVDYLLQALQAVAEGHTNGVVHRDLKPSNLFVTYRADDSALIKVVDFGIAKTTTGDFEIAEALTGSDDVRLGSPSYMSPEQLKNPRDVDGRSDIWSLGVTLYELLSASAPFNGKTYVELLSQILGGHFTPLSARPELKIPIELERIIARCLCSDPAHRFNNVGELAFALAPFGSEDAQVSLARIRGLRSSRPPKPIANAVPSGAGDMSVACTTTVAAPGTEAVDQDSERAQAVSLDTRKHLLRQPMLWGSGSIVLMVGALLARHLWQLPSSPAPNAALASHISRKSVVPSAAPQTTGSPPVGGTTPASSTSSSPSAHPTQKSSPPSVPNRKPLRASPVPSASVAASSLPPLDSADMMEKLIDRRH